MSDKKRTLDIDSNAFLNDPDRFDWADQMGENVNLVDSSYGFVPTNKDRSNLDKSQANIRKRFNLGE